ncbi:DUF2920 family protein [Jeotgalibacillus aurantiacus]|uniref:DUF2920 family protein n=1 Tax=Jeotgalibacillus aurantiacus TaxID=2763266 RepID=UPI001D0B8C8C|nr:DUF2920 family protein [Jeotgalibacillus aurantiacus]
MTKNYNFSIAGHPSIYEERPSERQLKIEFSTPDVVNKNTGIMILVPGFGAHIDSNVYKKMRDLFADTYNLVVLQVEYFGSSFMQNSHEIEGIKLDFLTEDELVQINTGQVKLFELVATKSIKIRTNAKLDESLSDFNDMGYMQAIDIITAIEAVKLILEDNKVTYDKSKVIGYGHSHGAYLLHLVNTIEPDLLSLLVDNSSWLVPGYLTAERDLYKQLGQAVIHIKYKYLAQDFFRYKEIHDLSKMYLNHINNCKIIAFQGDSDPLVNHLKKQEWLASIDHTTYFQIGKGEIDNKIFFSNGHGLDADFILLFEKAMHISDATPPVIPALDHQKKYRNSSLIYLKTDGLPKYKFNHDQ